MTGTLKIKSGFSGERSIVLPRMILDMMAADPVAAMLHITDIGYYPKALHHYRRREEPIDQHVLIYCTDGRGWYETDGSRHFVGPDQWFMLPAGIPHAYGSDDSDPWTIYWVHFRGSKASLFLPADPSPHDIAPRQNSRIAHRLELFDEIMATLDDSFGIENIRYASAAFHYFLESIRYLRLYRQAGRGSDDSDIVASTIHFIEENIERHLSLREIADYAGFSASYLSALFKRRAGYSPLTYLNIMKIRRACVLLDTTTMKINQISSKLGFNDQLYFSRLFSKIMEMSPSDYRSRPKG